MRAGDITVDGSMIGTIEINLPDTAENLIPFTGEYNPSGRSGDSDTGKSFHHHGIGHSRPSHEPTTRRNQHHFPGHQHHPAPGRHHYPGHHPQHEKDNNLGSIPYSKTGNPFDRDRFKKELEEKPWLREKIKHISLGENQDPHANLAVMETMMNRAVVRGTSLEQQARRHRSSGKDEQGYYAGYASSYNAQKGEMADRNIAEALKGSNITNYATDNSSGSLADRERASGAFKHHRTINRESFFSPGRAEPALRDRWDRLNQKAQEHENDKTTTNPVIDPTIEPM